MNKPYLSAPETLLAILAGCTIALWLPVRPATVLPAPLRAVCTPAPTPRVTVADRERLSFNF